MEIAVLMDGAWMENEFGDGRWETGVEKKWQTAKGHGSRGAEIFILRSGEFSYLCPLAAA